MSLVGLAVAGLAGCKDVTLGRLNQSPVALPSATPSSGPAPLTVAFTASATDSDGKIVGYSWTFGDGTTSSQANPTHMYTSSGSFTATLSVTDDGGAKGSSTVPITVDVPANQPPVATASATPISGKAPLTVTFTGGGNDPDGTIASYAWMFGDGGSSAQQSPTHTYQTSGNFTATLTVTDNGGATGSTTVLITAGNNQPPTASASATPTSGKAPLAVSFTGTGTDSDGTVASYAWTFGDGGTSSLQNPTHTYQTPGNYSATLTVTDNNGAKGTSTVSISAAANQPPTASASATPMSGKAPLSVAFTGSGSDPDGTIASYGWTFGDGGSSSLQNPTHTYQSAGSFTATLTVTDNNGATGTSSVAITAAANTPPTATASAVPTSGLAPLAVSFTGSGSDPDGTIVSYAWTFGDGGTSNAQNPSHTYQTAGNFTATLTVTDNNGATGSASVAISVTSAGNQPPTASASATPTSGLAPLLVTFTGTGSDSDGTIVSYAWTFGDGGTSSLQNPTHTYQSPGSYTATLTVTDNGGATGSSIVTISATANQPPTATASATPTSGKAPLLVTFTGSGTDPDGTIVSYAWTFGDGGTSSLQNPTHTYQSPGNYTATLKVTDNGGATGSSTVGISVVSNQPPTASASATPTSGTAPLLVTFTGSGTDPDGTIVSYAWTFGDGGTSSLQSPTHTYASAGTYTATLTVTDNNGATGSSSVVITVSASTNQAPIANAGPDQLNKDPGTTIQLDGTGSSDPDGSITSYQWTQTAGATVTLTGANTATPSFVAPAKTTATYTFTLTVMDNGSPQLSAQDSVTITTRVTYLNTTKAMIDARPNQPNGTKLGCTQSGCHTTGGQSPPLLTYANVYSNRAKVRTKIQTGETMRKYLLTGEPEIVTAWIDNGAPEKN